MPQSSETTLDPQAQAQNVAVPGLGVVAFPGGMNPDEMSNHIRMHLSRMQSATSSHPGMQGLIPSDAGIRSQTWGDKLRQARDQIGKIVAPFVGLDWQQMADDESKGILRQMLAFHGSPHTFDQFDISKIGTGEGAQAYGHGLYFAEDPQVAKQYQQRLTSTIPGASEGRSKYQVSGAEFPKGRSGHAALDTAQDIESMLSYRKMGSTEMENLLKDNIERRIGNFYKTTTGQGSAYQDMDALVSYYIRHAKDAPAEKILENRGAFYTAHIPDEHIAKMLDWDKPFNEQSTEVQEALKPIVDYLKSDPNFAGSARPSLDAGRITGGDLYRVLGGEMSIRGHLPNSGKVAPTIGTRYSGDAMDKAASKMLHDNGIPGIKYLDQGSRAVGEGTRNFVVFDPSIIESVERE